MTKPKPLTALKILRLERGLDRYKVAELIGVSDRTLKRWEAGDIPGLDDAAKLADVYGVTLDQLAGRAPLPSHDPAA